MEYTSNLNLKKPSGTDVVNIQDLNDNVDIIDLEITQTATTTQDGRMSKEDKAKIDGIEDQANKYIHPSTHSLDIVTETTAKKVMTATERTKLAGVEDNANNYAHPFTHSMDIITETTTKKVMTAGERIKLSGVADNANNYTHPSTHTASMITQDSSHRFVTDSEKTSWNAKPSSQRAISDSVTSTSSSTAASSKAAKTAYDKGVAALTAANAKLNSSAYTAGDVLTKIKTVDGSGSGLDADTVDGCHVDTDYNGTAYQVARYNANKRVYDSDRLQGAVPSTSNTGNTIAKRDSAGDVNCRLLRPTYTSTTSSPNYILVQHAVGSGVDNYARPCTLANLKSSLGSMPANGGNSDTVDGKQASGTLVTSEKTNLVTAINELFTNVSDGKNTIASAITDKGVTASGSDTFATMATKIRNITTGVRYASGSTTGATIAATLGWEAKLIVVKGTNGFWVFKKSQWSTTYPSGYTTATSYYNTIHTDPNYNAAYQGSWAGTWDANGFSLTVPDGAYGGTLTWYAYELAP